MRLQCNHSCFMNNSGKVSFLLFLSLKMPYIVLQMVVVKDSNSNYSFLKVWTFSHFPQLHGSLIIMFGLCILFSQWRSLLKEVFSLKIWLIWCWHSLFLMNRTKHQVSWVPSHNLFWEININFTCHCLHPTKCEELILIFIWKLN